MLRAGGRGCVQDQGWGRVYIRCRMVDSDYCWRQIRRSKIYKTAHECFLAVQEIFKSLQCTSEVKV